MSALVHVDNFYNIGLLNSLEAEERELLDTLNCGHYHCMLWACLRYRLALEKSVAIIVQLSIAAQIGVNIVNPNVILPRNLPQLEVRE